MVSRALSYWRGELSDRLDELEGVHQTATGAGPGRRWGTAQFNGQLFVALVGQFQSYARSLHDEALDVLRQGPPTSVQLATLAAQGRKLDTGNPRPSALGSDFGRLGMKLVPPSSVVSTEPRGWTDSSKPLTYGTESRTLTTCRSLGSEVLPRVGVPYVPWVPTGSIGQRSTDWPQIWMTWLRTMSVG